MREEAVNFGAPDGPGRGVERIRSEEVIPDQQSSRLEDAQYFSRRFQTFCSLERSKNGELQRKIKDAVAGGDGAAIGLEKCRVRRHGTGGVDPGSIEIQADQAPAIKAILRELRHPVSPSAADIGDREIGMR